jgi:hypothetical protein
MAEGGSAKSVQIVTTGPVVGGPAIPVYGVITGPIEGGPALKVYVCTTAELAIRGGIQGNPQPMVVCEAGAGTPVVGGAAIPVFPVNAWP